MTTTSTNIGPVSEQMHWSAKLGRKLTYWSAADYYDNESGTVAEDQLMASHTHTNRVNSACMVIPAAFGGLAAMHILSFGTLPLWSTTALSTGYALSYYTIERMLFAGMTTEKAMEELGVDDASSFSKGAKLGLRSALAIANAGIVSVLYNTYYLQPEIDNKLYLLDQTQNEALYEVFDSTTESARQRSQNLTEEIDALQIRMAQQETFLGQLITGEFDPEASPEVINLRDQIGEAEAGIVTLESDKAALELSIRGKQDDIRLYTDIIQAETLGKSLTITLSTGETVATSNAGIPGCGSSCEGLKDKQDNLRIEIRNDQGEVTGFSESIQELQQTRTELLRTVNDIISDFDGETVREDLIAKTESTISSIESRIDQKTQERSAQLSVIKLAFDEMQDDPTYQDPYSPSNIIASIGEVKEERNSPTVTTYFNAVAGAIFIMEILPFLMMKMRSASAVSMRRARKKIQSVSEEFKLTQKADKDMKAEKIERDHQKAMHKDLGYVLRKHKGLTLEDKSTIMTAMRDVAAGNLSDESLTEVSKLVEVSKQAIAEQPKWYRFGKKIPAPSA
jgi:hypothetical protein